LAVGIFLKEELMNAVQQALAPPGVKPHTVKVSVNRKEVVFHVEEAKGAEIKATAIKQGVDIHQDFNLFIVKGHGKLDQVGDNEEVKLHEGEEFRAVAPDDNS
jgi:hypothetical protein